MSDLTSWLHEFADACEIVAAGRWPGPRTAARLREVADALAAAKQQGQAVDCHCATCTCAPGMTPAVRFDTSQAAKEGAVRDHLIALGWTPPGAQQPDKSALDMAEANAALLDEIREIVGLKGKPGCVIKAVRELVRESARKSPPSSEPWDAVLPLSVKVLAGMLFGVLAAVLVSLLVSLVMGGLDP